MLSEIVTGALTQVVVTAGRRVGSAISGFGDGRYRDDLEIANWFNTYLLTEQAPDLPLPTYATEDAVSELLNADGCQAVLHELLAARLCDAPELDISRLRSTFRYQFWELENSVYVDRFSTELFDYYDDQISTLVARLEGGLPNALPKLRQGAVATRVIASLHAIERHTAAIATAPDLSADRDFLKRYRQHVIKEHGRIQPPDFERRRLVPVEDLYVSPDFTRIVGPADTAPPGIDIRLLANEIDRTVLLGDPGGGKTTASQVLMHHHAGSPKCRTPFLVTLREFAGHDRSVVWHIEHQLETFYQCRPPGDLVQRLLLDGSALVIFDGLDELVDTSRRAEMTSKIEHFATEYPHARILVTSRFVGYDQARLDERQFTCYRIGGFDDTRITEYVTKWFRQEPGLPASDADQWTAAFIEESASVPDLRTNPLMLALLCILYLGERSIPRNRAGVYERCANLLFDKWDARRGIHVELRTPHLVEPALRHLAHWLFTRDTAETAVTERQLRNRTAEFLSGRGIETPEEAGEAAREFVEFCTGRAWVFTDAGTTATGERLYAFTHRTFLEYFTAAHLAAGHDTPEQLAQTLVPHIARQEWEVVAELAIQMKNHAIDRGAERIVNALLSDRRRRTPLHRGSILRFLAVCLDSIELPPGVVRDLTRRILDHVFLTDPTSRDDDTSIPLAALLVSCQPCRDIVREEISARVAVMVDSRDSDTRLDGLRLAVLCDKGDWGNQRANRARNQSTEMREFWAATVTEHVDTYRTEILTAGTTDPLLQRTALIHELLSADDVFRHAERGFPELFKIVPMVLFPVWWSPYMLDQIGTVLGHRFSGTSTARADCAALGRLLTENWTVPPWNVHTSYTRIMFVEPARATRLEGAAYVGAAVGLLIFVESAGSHVQARPEAFAAVSELWPYVERRLAPHVTGQLPPLPVPDHIQEAITAWADRRLDFLTETQGS